MGALSAMASAAISVSENLGISAVSRRVTGKRCLSHLEKIYPDRVRPVKISMA
ncbi:MAG: hypothetical protein HC871_01935 [Rhizobiales bacterium]|nr:hypothetical protein [Hyphomicrobiales bacterium]